jgi:hypothetical protein
MSKTTPAGLGDFHLWIYDASLALLLAQLIGIVESTPEDERPPWWPHVVDGLRVHAAVGDLYFDVDLGLDDRDQHQLAELYEQAAEQVRARGIFTPEEAEAWVILDDLRVIFRGDRPVDTAPVAQLGHALAALIRGELPAAPRGQSWYYGTPNGPTTIGNGQG